MTPPAAGGEDHGAAGRLRTVAMVMAGSLALLLAVVLFVVPEDGATAAGPLVNLGLAGTGLGLIVVGLVLAVSAAGAEPGPGRAARVIVSLAVREGGGLLGWPLAFLGAGRAWAAALLGLALLSILALLPPRSAAA